MLLEVVKIEYLVKFFLILFLAFVGSFSKDYSNLITFKSGKISIPKVLISTITASLVTFAISDYIEKNFGVGGLMLVSYLIGVLGFQIFKRVSTIDGLIAFIKEIFGLIKDFMEFRNGSKKDKDEEKNKNDE